MARVEKEGPILVVTLSERNLLSLLTKLHTEGSKCQIENTDVPDDILFVRIQGELDDVHYSSQVNEQAEADYINLEQLVVAAQQTFSGSFVREHLNARVLGPTISDDLTYQLYAYVLAEKVLEDDVTLDWHGRASFDVYGWRNRLRLLFGRHRVNGIVDGTVTVPATYWRKFPAANVHVDALGAPVRWAQLHTPRWEQEGET